MKFVPLLLLSVFLVITLSAYSQTDTSFLVRAVNTLEKQPAVEKVYLHLNKPAYAIYDTIWYKAYTVIGQHHQLSGLSKVLHVELINPHDSVIIRQTLPLISGVAWGNIALSRKFKQGDYRIRAYTNWIRNAGPDYFYDQKIRVGGTFPVLNAAKKPAQFKPDIRFFPEGGELVNGVRSKVAVKAVNSKGFGQDITGTILDNEGNEVVGFATQHLGMGAFAFTPQAGKTYKASIATADGPAITIELPKAQEEGYTLAINNSAADSVYVTIAVNDKMLQAMQNSRFYLIAQSTGKVYYTSEGKLGHLVFASTIAKSRFPSGVVQFTLFDQNMGPVAERIAFIQSADTLKMGLSSVDSVYTVRQKVKISLDAKNGAGQPITGLFSASVINESRLGIDETDESTIMNNLLLTSDLKGYIEKPNYYFIKPNGQTEADLDILMLAQGYRRFEWKKIMDNSPAPVTFQPERSLELSGVIKTPSGKPVPNGKVLLMSTKANLLRDTTTDANGNFKFTGLYLSDTAKIVIQARKARNGSNVAIYVKKPDYPMVTNDKRAGTAGDSLLADLSPEMLKNMAEYQRKQKLDSIKSRTALKTVTITAKKTVKPDLYNDYGTVPERNLDMKRVNDFTSVDQAIHELAPSFNGRVIIDGLEITPSILSTYVPREINDIRLVDGGGYDRLHAKPDKPPYIILTTKRYAGTDTTVLKEVVIKAKKINKGPDLSNSENLNGPGNADQVIMGDKIEGCVILSDCLNGWVFGVRFDGNGVPYSARAQGRLSGGLPMVVIIDGNLLDGTHLNDLNANDIYSIEVLRSGAYLAVYGSNAPGGALVITTRHGGEPNYVSSEEPSGLITYPFQGFYKARVFYSPQYNNPKANAQADDFRTAIYWQPNIITDKDGKASFEYFNSDTRGAYRVVVEGIDDNGNLGRRVYRYVVQ